jgi:hypothetical protein
MSIEDGGFSDRQRLTHLIRQADFCLRGDLHGLAVAAVRPNVDWTVDDCNCEQQLFRRAMDKQILRMGYPNNDPEKRTDANTAYEARLRAEHQMTTITSIGRSNGLTVDWDDARQMSTLKDRAGRVLAAGFKWQAVDGGVQITLPGTAVTVVGHAF